jgi:hypothetical protein
VLELAGCAPLAGVRLERKAHRPRRCRRRRCCRRFSPRPFDLRCAVNTTIGSSGSSSNAISVTATAATVTLAGAWLWSKITFPLLGEEHGACFYFQVLGQCHDAPQLFLLRIVFVA